MAYKISLPRKSLPATGSTSVEFGEKTKQGSETWHVTTDGEKVTIVTSGTSTTVLDEAVTIYKPALKRLAKK